MRTLKDVIQEQLNLTKVIIDQYPWHDPRGYGMWLAQTYHMVCHSTRLVALAGAYAPLDKTNLHWRFIDHAKEERGHEKLCIQDINALGFKIEDFPKTYQSQAIAQVQYYWVQHHNPIALFGYILSLECLAEQFGPQVGQAVMKSHGEKATKFLRVHSEEDVEHTQSAYEQISKMGTNEIELITENLILSSDIYRGMISASMEWSIRHPMKHVKKVA